MTAEVLLGELADPACYPHAPQQVRLIQTHLSVVCIAGDLVYKLKKAVRLPFVDFSTLAARRHACREEVRLNRRLCPAIYLGTAALRRIAGRLRFAALGDDAGADDLDIAVVMQRLPQERMLDELLRTGGVTLAEIERLAVLVSRFHAVADRGPAVTAHGDPQRLLGFAAANFTELGAAPYQGMDPELLAALAAASRTLFAALLPALERRAAAGHVVDGHGDLHARNICMTDPPAIYDCIEFEPAFRCGDVATEVAFLAMDLRHRSAPGLAAAFVDAYGAASGDAELPALLPALCCYRAMVRAKVAALAAAEPELPAAQRQAARASAHQHLMLAAAFAIEARGALWIAVAGPPASGKSLLCRTLAAPTAWPIASTDVLRKQLAGADAGTRLGAEYYTEDFSRRTYAAVLAAARQLTSSGQRVVLLDGNFPTPDHRTAASAAAAAAGARLLVAALDIAPEVAAARAAARAAQEADASDADAGVAARLHARFTPPDAGEGPALIQLDGSLASEALAAHVLAAALRLT